MTDWKRMFELKQDDWITVCKEVDQLRAQLAEIKRDCARDTQELSRCLSIESAKLAAAQKETEQLRALLEAAHKAEDAKADYARESLAKLRIATEALEWIGTEWKLRRGYGPANGEDCAEKARDALAKLKGEKCPCSNGDCVDCHAKLPDTSQSRDCKCSHHISSHIYEEGACRPGFVCPYNCQKFEAKSEKEKKDGVS